MTDYISRSDAIDAVRKCVVESELLADWNKAMESAQELLSALPSADAAQGWIPCSERLPEFPFISCDAHGNIHVPQGILTFEDSRGTWCIDDIYDKGKGMNYGNRIIAWMPLPTPYKGGDAE